MLWQHPDGPMTEGVLFVFAKCPPFLTSRSGKFVVPFDAPGCRWYDLYEFTYSGEEQFVQ